MYSVQWKKFYVSPNIRVLTWRSVVCASHLMCTREIKKNAKSRLILKGQGKYSNVSYWNKVRSCLLQCPGSGEGSKVEKVFTEMNFLWGNPVLWKQAVHVHPIKTYRKADTEPYSISVSAMWRVSSGLPYAATAILPLLPIEYEAALISEQARKFWKIHSH